MTMRLHGNAAPQTIAATVSAMHSFARTTISAGRPS